MTMKNKELQKLLKKLPPDFDVVGYNGDKYRPISVYLQDYSDVEPIEERPPPVIVIDCD